MIHGQCNFLKADADVRVCCLVQALLSLEFIRSCFKQAFYSVYELHFSFHTW